MSGTNGGTNIGRYDDKETCLMMAKGRKPTPKAVTYYSDPNHSTVYKECYVSNGDVIATTGAGGIVCKLT